MANINQFSIVTGASGGIGYELCKVMASKKHNLILVARSENKLKEISESLSREYGIEVKYYIYDLSDCNQRLDFIAKIRKNGYSVNILVNNAGFGDTGYFYEADWEKNERMIQLNITALTHLTREFLPDLIKSNKGRILNVASIAGYLPGPLMSVYYASKSFVVSFSDALYSELKGTGVTVTTLSPGPVETNFFNEAGAADAHITSIIRPASASHVAAYAYRRMMKGRKRAIPGWTNNLMILGIRFVPTELTNSILKRLHS